MTNSIIFKTFKTFKHSYVYDRHTNSITLLTEKEHDELHEVETSKMSYEESAVVSKFQTSDMLIPNVVEKIEHPATDILEQRLSTRVKQLTLQVTQQCNLRCSYCAYSGIYENSRTHSSKRMNFETAARAIDFFLQRNTELSDVVIGFYGGEPLLEFDLIKRCVEYAKSQVEGKRIRFNITTNGTLLNDHIVDYLVENDFSLGISIDGPEQEHNVNRKFANGDGSFNAIMDNIRRVKERYPEYGQAIMVLTTLNPFMELGCTLEFFSTEELFGDTQIMFNSMKESNLNQELSYSEDHYRLRSYEHIKMLLSLIGKLDKKYVSKLTAASRDRVKQGQKHKREHTAMSPVMHHGGPCMAGVHRLFVRVDGVLFPCERVNELLDYFMIGTLENGIDISKTTALMNIGKVTEAECKNCWNLRHCAICSGEVEFDGVLTRDDKLKTCPKTCSNTFAEMYELCVLNEFGLKSESILF